LLFIHRIKHVFMYILRTIHCSLQIYFIQKRFLSEIKITEALFSTILRQIT